MCISVLSVFIAICGNNRIDSAIWFTSPIKIPWNKFGFALPFRHSQQAQNYHTLKWAYNVAYRPLNFHGNHRYSCAAGALCTKNVFQLFTKQIMRIANYNLPFHAKCQMNNYYPLHYAYDVLNNNGIYEIYSNLLCELCEHYTHTAVYILHSICAKVPFHTSTTAASCCRICFWYRLRTSARVYSS